LVYEKGAVDRTVTSNSINSLFMKKLGDDELTEIVDELINRKMVIVNGTKVSYDLPT
jgi:hypothetical protein